MEFEKILLLLYGVAAVRLYSRRRQQSDRQIKKREVWVNDLYLKRDEYSFYNAVLPMLINNNQVNSRDLLRFEHDSFLCLVHQLTPALQKKSKFRKSLSPGFKVAVLLKFLAHGESYSCLRFSALVAKNTLSVIIPEVCSAIIKILGPKYLKIPSTIAEWTKISDQFNEKWQFPKCLGAVDGKHVAIQAPPGAGSKYFNYKLFNSIVLLGTQFLFNQFDY